jgi:hypothetical protein
MPLVSLAARCVPTIFNHETENDLKQSLDGSIHIRFLYPWFDAKEFSKERLSKQIRLTSDEKASVQSAQSVLHGWVLPDPLKYISGGCFPP